jgi:catalase
VPPGTSEPGPRGNNGGITAAPTLSLENQPKPGIATRKIAMLVADGFDGATAETVRAALVKRGAIVEVIAPVLGPATPDAGSPLEADKTYQTAASIFYDAVFVPGGAASAAALRQIGNAVHFLREAFKHHKAIAATGDAVDLLAHADLGAAMLAGSKGGQVSEEHGLVTVRDAGGVAALADAFVDAIAKHRHWDRRTESVPA